MALAWCYLFGFLGWLGATPGLVVGLATYSGVPLARSWLLVGLLCAYLAVPYGLFGYLHGRFQWLRHPLGPLHAAACLTLLLSWFPSPLPVGPAHSLTAYPVLVQLLDLGGEPLLLYVFILANWLAANLLLRLRDAKRLALSLGSLFSLCAFVIAYGSYRLHQYHVAETAGGPGRFVQVAAVQPNLTLPKEDSEQPGDPVEQLLQMSNQVLAKHPDIDLVIWPETPKSLDCSKRSTSRRRIGKTASATGTPFMINCEREVPSGGNYNTALLMESASDVRFYNKHMLFPFAENVPGESFLPILRKLAPGAGRYVPGNNVTVFALAGGWRAAPTICYEIMFTNHVRKLMTQGGEVLLNQSNDAWFGQSRIADFMIASGTMQSVAYRVPMVRVSNSGNSLVVKASGELSPGTRTPSAVATTFAYSVFIPAKRSPYAVIGNAFLYVLTLIWSFNLWRGKRGKIRIAE
jgi:apolipoprotein N-acyltransferase